MVVVKSLLCFILVLGGRRMGNMSWEVEVGLLTPLLKFVEGSMGKRLIVGFMDLLGTTQTQELKLYLYFLYKNKR